jgi:hypothetical protein
MARLGPFPEYGLVDQDGRGTLGFRLWHQFRERNWLSHKLAIVNNSCCIVQETPTTMNPGSSRS